VRGADLSLNHGAGRRMVRFDHIAVMGICGLNAVDTLWLQISLLITMRNNGVISSTPAGCVPSGAAGRAKHARPACVMAGLVPQVGFTRLAALKWVRNSGRPELRFNPSRFVEKFSEDDGCTGQSPRMTMVTTSKTKCVTVLTFREWRAHEKS
jgi:hypothetical protein